MNNQSLLLRALWSALGVTAYVVLIGTVVVNGERIFGPVEPGIIGPIAFLLLFVFSALVTSSLVLLAPIRLYLDGQKTEGVRLLLYTATWLGIFTVLAGITLLVI